MFTFNFWNNSKTNEKAADDAETTNHAKNQEQPGKPTETTNHAKNQDQPGEPPLKSDASSTSSHSGFRNELSLNAVHNDLIIKLGKTKKKKFEEKDLFKLLSDCDDNNFDWICNATFDSTAPYQLYRFVEEELNKSNNTQNRTRQKNRQDKSISSASATKSKKRANDQVNSKDSTAAKKRVNDQVNSKHSTAAKKKNYKQMFEETEKKLHDTQQELYMTKQAKVKDLKENPKKGEWAGKKLLEWGKELHAHHPDIRGLVEPILVVKDHVYRRKQGQILDGTLYRDTPNLSIVSHSRATADSVIKALSNPTGFNLQYIHTFDEFKASVFEMTKTPKKSKGSNAQTSKKRKRSIAQTPKKPKNSSHVNGSKQSK